MIFALLVLTAIFLCAMLVVAWDKIVAGKVPFVGLHGKALAQIVPCLEITPEDVFYDLGCGDGRVLLAAHRVQPQARYMGIERAIVPYIVARWRTRKYPNISVRFGNMLSQNYAETTIVFAYLLPELLSSVLDVVYASASPRKVVLVQYTSPRHLAGKKHILEGHMHIVRHWYELDL